ncbi:MAG: tetratricopeptide repeat protein [Nitrososphaeraceae archaeon]
MRSNETKEHKLLKKIMYLQLKKWFNGCTILEYPNSGHELDVYSVLSGIKVAVEIIWSDSSTHFYKDINILQSSDADVKICIVNPKILLKENLLRHYDKVSVGETSKGFVLSEMIDGQKIMDDKEFLENEVKNLVLNLISNSSSIQNKFLSDLNVLGISQKIHLFNKDQYLGDPDVNCWKRGTFELQDIKHGLDGRRDIIDTIKRSIETRVGTIIIGSSFSGKSLILKRLIYEMIENGYSVLEIHELDFNPDLMIELINRVKQWNTRILIVSDNCQESNKINTFKVFNHFQRNKSLDLKFLYTCDPIKLSNTKILLEHDRNSEIDYAYSYLNKIEIKFEIADARVYLNKIKELGLINENSDILNLAKNFFKSSKGKPLIFFDQLRWLISDDIKNYDHPVLNYDLKKKSQNMASDRDLIKSAIYVTFLGTFGINLDTDLLSRCGILMNQLIKLSKMDIINKNGDFNIHEAWAIHYLLYLYNEICGSDLKTFDSLYNIKEIIHCIFTKFDSDSIIIILQRTALLYKETQYQKMINDFKECYPEMENLSSDEKVKMFTFGYAQFYSTIKDYSKSLEFFNKSLEIDPFYIPALNNKGTILHELEDNQSAIVCYNKVLSKEPQNINALYNKGTSLQALGKNKEAIDCYQIIVNNNPYDAYTWLNMGNAYGSLEDYDKAEICYNKALTVDPENISAKGYALTNKGNILSNQNKYEEAIKNYDNALKLLPNDPVILLNKAKILGQKNEKQEALKILNVAIYNSPNDYLLLGEKGKILTELGNYDEAIKNFEKSININNNDISIFNNIANALRLSKRFDDALHKLDLALKINPNYVTALINKGLVYLSLDNYSTAIKYFDDALNIEPENIEANKLRGEIYNKLQNYDEAIKSFEKALIRGYSNSNLWTQKGLSELNNGLYFNAIKSFEKSIELNENNIIALSHLGTILANMGKEEDGLNNIDKAISIEPNYIFSWIHKASIMKMKGKYNDALRYLDRAISIDPNKKELWNERGTINFKIGEYPIALKEFDKAIKLDPNMAEYWYNKGYTLIKIGDRVNAETCFDKAVKLDKTLE